MADVEVIISGLSAVQSNMKQIANILSTPGVDAMLYNVGINLRAIARNHVGTAVYRTPQSKNYQRTRFLYETIYVATAETSDYDECFARGFAAAQATYPRRNNAKTYQMLPQMTPRAGGVIVAAGAIYAEHVEYGNGLVGPRPFMRPASDKAADVGTRQTNNYIRDYLSRAGKSSAATRTRTAGGQFARG